MRGLPHIEHAGELCEAEEAAISKGGATSCCSWTTAARLIKQFQAWAKVDFGKKLHVPRTDLGGEFMSVEFAAYCVD